MANKKTTTNNKTNNRQKSTNTKPNVEPKTNDIAVASKPVTKDIDLTQYITVLNGYHGKLNYQSSRTGETFKWNDFGAEQEMELRELRNAKNTHKKFFEKNWFMFDDEFKWVINYLGVGQYYKNAIDIADFDDIFQKSPDELKEVVMKLSDGQKKAVAFRAKTLIDEGEIDSNKTIRTLEEVLQVELIQRHD
ncbi:MAG: hypothetical protein IIW72_03290 [Clostridia bacterium]|nr:hypothetical protein [Clostridia bacterium]